MLDENKVRKETPAGEFTVADFSRHFDISASTADRLIKSFLKDGFLEVAGKSSNPHQIGPKPRVFRRKTNG